MPQGQLFFRTKETKTDGQNPQIVWFDAFDKYRMSLEDGAISKIMTPAPHKAPVSATSAVTDGRAFLGGTIGKVDGRTLSFDVHFTAGSESQFLTRYYAFCQQIIGCGYVEMYIVLPGGSRFPMNGNANGAMHLVYQDCQPFQQFAMGLAKFTLSFEEPHPEIVTEDIQGIWNRV